MDGRDGQDQVTLSLKKRNATVAEILNAVVAQRPDLAPDSGQWEPRRGGRLWRGFSDQSMLGIRGLVLENVQQELRHVIRRTCNKL